MPRKQRFGGIFVKKRQLIAGILVAVMLSVQALTVTADYSEQIQAAESQRDVTASELYQIQDAINGLEVQKQEIAGEIDSLDAKLVRSIALIDSLKDQVAKKETDLKETGKKLAAAEDDKDLQYEAMKKRIQYLYETGGDAGWAVVLFEDRDLSNLLNRAEFSQNMYNYDRECLNTYVLIVRQVEELRDRQLKEKAELETMRAEEENEKKNLEALLVEARETFDNYEEQIASAESRAAEYRALIDQQNQEINRLVALQEEERRAAEAAAAAAAAAEAARQEAARAAEEARQEAARQAAQQAAAQQAAQQSTQESSTTYESSAPMSDEEARQQALNDAAYAAESSGSSYTEETYEESYEETAEETYVEQAPAVGSGGVTGQDVVNFALNFVGYPYVWGGNDLYNGVDCSGFTQQLYLHFGYSISRTTYTQMYDGIGVSYAEAQPGDLIVYDGHVALYMGGGQIVHASDSRTGIIIGNNPAYRPIIAVRRIIY